MDELLWHDGCGYYRECTNCPQCGSPGITTVKCTDCFGGRMVCVECTLRNHVWMPLHRLQVCTNDSCMSLGAYINTTGYKVWNGLYHERKTLKELGHSVQLGPHIDGCCPCPRAAHEDFIVINTEIIQEVRVLFCGCAHAENHHTQLLHVRWYPTTVPYLRTACTFNALHFFQLLSLQSKTSAYDFYRSTSWATDNTGLNPPPVIFQSILS